MSKEVCEHFCHAIVLAVFLCLGMKYLLNQSDEVACTRSAFIAGVAFIYMIMFLIVFISFSHFLISFNSF